MTCRPPVRAAAASTTTSCFAAETSRLPPDGTVHAMTDIDSQADIEVRSAHEHVTARVPLAGQVTSEWIRCYQRLARATDVPVRAEAGPDRAWIVVSVSA